MNANQVIPQKFSVVDSNSEVYKAQGIIFSEPILSAAKNE